MNDRQAAARPLRDFAPGRLSPKARGDEASSLSAEIVRRLEAEVLSGALRPGDRLDERQLAERYGVSRTPVREGLQRLAASGLVVARGRQGLQVAQLSVADLLDAFSVVAELEALAAAQAARRIIAAERERLLAAHSACEAAVKQADAHAFYEANREFHDTIAEASQNRVLQDELRRLTLKTSPYRRAITFLPGRMTASVPEHAAVLEAILGSDAPRAGEAMRSHVSLLGGGISDLLHFLRISGDDILLSETAGRR